MKVAPILALVLLSLTSGLIHARPAHSVRVGYYPSWNEGSITDVAGDQLTHLVYAFLSVSEDGECEILPDTAKESQRALDAFSSIKNKFPHLKTLLAIGGAHNSNHISKSIQTVAGRKKLVRSCVAFATDYQFDGIDLDWEFPSRKDRSVHVQLLKEFRRQLPEGSVLTAAVPGDESVRDLDVAGIAGAVDWLGVMAYDRCDEDAKTTCYHAQFVSSGSKLLSGADVLDRYIEAGARPDQLVLGIPFYGYKWTVNALDDENHGINQRIVASSGRKRAVEVSFAQIQKKYMQHKNWTYFYDEEAQAPVLFNSNTSEVISYEDERSLAYKKKEAERLGLAGLMIWDLASDDQNVLLQVLNRR